MKRKICFHDIDWVPDVGHEFHLVEKFWTNTGESRLDGHSETQRTNQSRELLVEGWLGTTDNIHKEGLGRYRVVAVLGDRPEYWNKGIEVEIEKIS